MKNILAKVSYMAFGCLLTPIGSHFGNINNNSTEAQRIPRENAQDELRCRSLVIVGESETRKMLIMK